MMTVSGMTGFGRAEGVHEGWRWTWEARSVNGRGLDLKLRTPPGFDALEAGVRAHAARRFRRGSVQAGLILQPPESMRAARIDLGFVQSLIEAGRPFVESGAAAPPRWDGLLLVRGALVQDEDPFAAGDGARAALEAALIAGADAAFAALEGARRREGAALAGVLNDLIARIDALTLAAEGAAGAAPSALLARLKARLMTLSPEVQFDPQRLAQEAALAASKADVAEEIARLKAHVAEARALMGASDGAGRKLDFLAQEFTREANTLCAKASELDLTRIGLELKAMIDQLKEQAANVE